eukprot:396987_1
MDNNGAKQTTNRKGKLSMNTTQEAGELSSDDSVDEKLKHAEDDYKWLRENLVLVQSATKELQNLSEKAKTEHRQTQKSEMMGRVKDNQRRAMLLSESIRQKLSAMNAKIESDSGAYSLVQVKRNMLREYSRQFQSAVSDYRDASEKFEDDLRAKISRQAKIVNKDVTESEMDHIMSSRDPHVLLQEFLIGESVNKAVTERVAELEAQHTQYKHIERNMAQIQQLFVDLDLLVASQGEQLDRIVENIDAAGQHTSEAKVEIVKAKDHHEKAKKTEWKVMGCICCILILIICALSGYVKMLLP